MNKRENYYSLARIISAISVVTIHTNAIFCWQFDVNKCWHWGNIIDCICSFAVPVFIMISGATLLDYSERYSTTVFYKKRIEKTVIPFISWSIIGLLYEKIMGASGIMWVYYFFFNLFGVYLCLPLFSYVKKEYKLKIVAYLVLVSFVLNYVCPFFESFVGYKLSFKIPFEVAENYLIYALLGYIISKKNFTIKKSILIYALGFVGLLLQYILSLDIGVNNNPFRAYTALPCFLYAMGVFVFIKGITSKIQNENILNLIEKISHYTFPVYLLHWFILDFLVKPYLTSIHSSFFRICIPYMVFLVCILLAWILRKIPVLKYLLP